MKKSTKLFKRFFALLLVVLMSIESIGAVVSDNDGSAFITKAEFDSLKNNFQSQIDQYNTSIDSKIDGAIASYLAGINVAKTEELVSNLASLEKNYNVWWNNTTGSFQGDRITYSMSAEIQLGGRGTGYGDSNVRQIKKTASYDGGYKKFPIIAQDDTNSFYELSYFEDRQPFVDYKGFFMINTDDYQSFFASSKMMNGVFSTRNFNDNINKTIERLDQWWAPKSQSEWSGGPTWAMSIWGVYSTKKQNRDNANIYMWVNGGSTYCWNESDQRLSTGQNDGLNLPNQHNGGSWNNGGGAQVATAGATFTGYTNTATAYFPWCHTTYTYKDLYDTRINTTTGVKSPISMGLLLTSGKGPGTLEINCYGDISANMKVTIRNNNNTGVLKTNTVNVLTTNKKLSIDLSELDDNEIFNVWIKYLPNNNAKLHISSILFTPIV